MMTMESRVGREGCSSQYQTDIRILNYTLCILATVLDPRFKLKVFYTASSAANARMVLIKEYEEYLLKL